jgi:hypothetical protein
VRGPIRDVEEDDDPFALRLARYCARNTLVLDRLTYDPTTERLTCISGKADGPTADTEAVDPLEFLATQTLAALARDARSDLGSFWPLRRPRETERAADDQPPVARRGPRGTAVAAGHGFAAPPHRPSATARSPAA